MSHDDKRDLNGGHRLISPPATISARARANLEKRDREQSIASFEASSLSEWQAVRDIGDARMVDRFREAREGFTGTIERQDWSGVGVSIVTPSHVRHPDCAILDLHGGAYLFGAGEVGVAMSLQQAEVCGCQTYSVDYRMPPEHPYPAGLEDAQNVYRQMLQRFSPGQIVISGYSAGGGLAGALALKLRDDGDPLPAALILLSPEADLTESGDSFRACVYPVDFGAINRLYANGTDLADPYLSPVFGDFGKGYPPTLITSGTRDFFLSTCALMHRKLRRAGVAAEIHIWEAMPHGGFDGYCVEDDDLRTEVARFVDKYLPPRNQEN